jgi:hypothetical protein
MNLKIINASQDHIYQHENTKRKLYCCNANIYFNRECIQKKLTPNYAKIKIQNSSPSAKHTLRKALTIKIKYELRFLHIKKQQLNHQLFKLHFSLANTWGKSWPYIQERIEDNLQKTIKSKYKTLDSKLLRLSQHQTTTPQKHHPFFPRVVSNTDVTFSQTELDLLNKGPRYSLHTRNKRCLTNLAIEAETAIKKLRASDRNYHRKQVSDHLTHLKSQHQTHTTPTHCSEYKTLRSIKTKRQENDATITSADKGNSLVILPTQQYSTKYKPS